MRRGRFATVLAVLGLLVVATGCNKAPNTGGGSSAASFTANQAVSYAPKSPCPKPASTVDATMPMSIPSALNAWMYIALDQGLFAKCGFKISTPSMNPDTQVSSYLAGQTSLRVSGAGFPAAIAVVKRPMGVYGLLGIKPWLYFIGSKSVSSPADLKGKTIAVLSPVDSTYKLALIYLEEHHIAASDVHFSYVNSTPSIYAAISSGAVQAAVLSPPNAQLAIAKGAHIMDGGDFSKNTSLQLPSQPIVADPSWVGQHQAVAVNLMRVIWAGVWLAHANPSILRASLIKHLSIDPSTSQGRLALSASIDEAQKIVMPVSQGLSLDPAWADLFKTQAPPDLQKKLKGIDMKTFVHPELGATLSKQGFVSQLQKIYGPER